ncbi:MAG TPA: histidinol-phosphate transaminase [Thermodesulfovibrionales bacterium]|nr:histidinol-phosphate transaminase [Thermodesulfovibrionales bacterium]
MKEINIQKLVKPSVRTLRAYEAKEISCKVKLDANESPYAFDRGLLNILKKVKTNRYPDPEAKELRRLIGKRFGVSPDTILQGNGSDELIYYLIATFGGPVLYPVPTFSMYGIIARALGEKPLPIPLDREFDIDLERTVKAVRREKPKLIFLSSPNNPTGNCFSAEKMLKIVEASKGIVVVDEAYQPFSSKKGFLPLLKDYRNLVIMRTLSKIGLAALRLGFLIADAEIIGEVNKVRLPFNVNALSQAIGAKALKDNRILNSSINTIVSERRRLSNEMGKIKSITPFPSEANFILFRTGDPEALYHGLLRRGVLVRNLNNAIEGCLRVTVGTPAENTIFLKAVKEALHEKGKG